MTVRPSRPALTLATMLAGLGSLVLAPLTFAAPAAPLAPLRTPTPPPDFTKSTCTVLSSTSVQPGVFLLGEEIAVTRTLHAHCTNRTYPMHIVFVLDGTAAMDGQPNRELRHAMHELIDALDPHLEQLARIAVVSFAERARQLCALTDQRHRIQACVGRVDAEGESSIAEGLQQGLRSLIAGRTQWPGLTRDDIREVIVLISGGGEAVACDRASRAAGQIDVQALLIAVCAGRDCDVPCMRGLASSPRYYFEARSIRELAGVFEPIRHALMSLVLRQLTITDTLSADVELVAATVHPTATTSMGPRTQIVWTTNHVPSDGYTVTYRVRPTTAGYLALSHDAYGTFRDTNNLPGRFAFARPWARVLGSLEPGSP